MLDAFIYDGLRTPIGRHAGKLAAVRPDDLAAEVIREVVARNALEPREISDVVLGCVNQAGEDNRNVARFAALLSGLPPTTPGVTVNRLCASGLQAVIDSARAITAGEGLVDLDDIHVPERQAGALKRARNGIRRPDAHDARLDAGAGCREDAGNRLATTSVPPLSIGDYQRCRPIVDSRGVPSGDYAAFEQRLEPGELVQRRVAPRVLVQADFLSRGILFPGGQGDGVDLALEEALLLGRGVLLLGGERELVGLAARDAEVLRHVIAGLRHRVVAELLDEPGIREARADGAVVQLDLPAVGGVRLADHVRRAAHALDAAGDVQVAFAGGDGARRIDDRLQAACAKPVHRDARRGRRQARQQRRETRHVAVVLARLVDAAQHHVADFARLERVARDDLPDHFGGEVVGAHRSQVSGVPSDRCTKSVIDEGV